MKKKSNILQYSIISIFIVVFIYLFFYFLTVIYIIPNNFYLPVILLIGFAIIIIIIFYCFKTIGHNDRSNSIVLNFKGLNENSIKILLMLLMAITIFIPPVSFSTTIIDWNQIGFYNYFRSIIFLIGIAFLPGSAIYNIILPKDTLHQKFNVEPFLLKITLYPILSFTFIELYTFILNLVGLFRENFIYFLFLAIVSLFIIDILIQKHRKINYFKMYLTDIKISKFSFLTLLISFGVIIIALGINIISKYSIPGDNWRAIGYALSIGGSDRVQLYTTGAYWGYLSFSLSILSGIPYVNINAMLFPFLYLVVLSIYLFMKAILHNLKEIYSVLATIFAISFSELFFISNSILGQDSIPWVIFDGLFFFRYKSFAFVLFLISTALFIIIAKTSEKIEKKPIYGKRNFIYVILGSFFLFQSSIQYFLPIIPGISLIIIYCFFSKRKKYDLQYFLLFFLSYVFFFIFFDVMTSFFLSYTYSTFLLSFFGFSNAFINEWVSLIAFFVYLILIGFLIFIFTIYKVYKKYFSNRFKKYYNFKKMSEIIFILMIGIFSFLLGLEVFFNIILKKQQNFFTFYIDVLFLNIGFIGILGIYLSYLSFKTDKQLFYTLLVWFIFLFGLGSILIFINGINYPFTPPQEIPSTDYYNMMYWFDRIWYYSILPLSIFASIGIIRIGNYVKARRCEVNNREKLKLFRSCIYASIIIFFSLSNTIIAGMDWNNKGYYVSNNQAQIIGWVSDNIPSRSNVLIEDHSIKYMADLNRYKYHFIDLVVTDALINYESWNFGDISYHIDSNCSIKFVEELDGKKNILKIDDLNATGYTSLNINFNSTQEYGSIEFFLRTTNKSKSFWINGSTNGISFAIASNAFYYYNGSSFNKIVDIENNIWNQIRFDFECTIGNYSGLNQYQWKTVINGIEYGEFNLWNNNSHIDNLIFMSGKDFTDWNVFINGLNFSWTPTYAFEYFLFKYPTIIDHLKLLNIQYYIHYNEDTYYNIVAGRSIDIENELLPYYYTEKLYQYKNMEIYSSLLV